MKKQQKKPSEETLLLLAAEARAGARGSVGLRLRVARQMAQKKTQELADDIECTPGRISQIENGTEIPRLDAEILELAALALGVSHDWLARGTGFAVSGPDSTPGLDATGAARLLEAFESMNNPSDDLKKFAREKMRVTSHYIAPQWMWSYWQQVRFIEQRLNDRHESETLDDNALLLWKSVLAQNESKNIEDKSALDAWNLALKIWKTVRQRDTEREWIHFPSNRIGDLLHILPIELYLEIIHQNNGEMEPRRRGTPRKNRSST